SRGLWAGLRGANHSMSGLDQLAAAMRRGAAVEPLGSRLVLGTRIDATSYADAVARVIGWAERHEARLVCHANVDMVMEAHDQPTLRSAINDADLVTADGVPLVWTLRLKGIERQGRVYGPDLMLALCQVAAQHHIRIGLLGSQEATLDRLVERLSAQIPGLTIGFRQAPPFRPLSPAEDEELVGDIAASEVAILFVALGCPKQERWMADHRHPIQ